MSNRPANIYSLAEPLGATRHITPSSDDLQRARRFAKRTRTAEACSQCRLARTRCDDARPCSRCVSKGLLCHTAPTPATSATSSSAINSAATIASSTFQVLGQTTLLAETGPQLPWQQVADETE